MADKLIHLQRATELGFEALNGLTPDQVRWLGAMPSIRGWRLPVLGDAIEVDTCARRVVASTGQEVNAKWRILALHYLAITGQPEKLAPEITFADLPTARSYAGVYHQRAIARLCALAGNPAGLAAVAGMLGGRTAGGGDMAFEFDVFPRLSLRALWHLGDEEFPPSATLLLPSNIESYFCSEDIVVLSECLVSRLSGRSFC